MKLREAHKNAFVAVACATALSVLADGESSVTAWAEDTIAVDVRTDECRAVGQAVIGYSPSWGGITNAGAYVVLQKVVGGVTTTVDTFAADAEASYSYAPGDGDSSFVKFIHRVYSSGGVEIGEPLVRDVAFGYRSAEGAEFVADSRADSLQLAVKERKPVALAYSTAWATNAAAVSVFAVQLSGSGGVPTATNAMFSAAADAEGMTPMRGVGMGWWRLVCQVKGESGDTLIEYRTDEFKAPGGLILSFW